MAFVEGSMCFFYYFFNFALTVFVQSLIDVSRGV